MKLVIEIPGLPKMANASGSTKSHWADKQREIKRWHMEVFIMARKAGWTAAQKPLHRAKLTLTRFSAQQPDFDGLVMGFKAVIDGLVRAHVLVNDRFENIGAPTYNWVQTEPNRGRIRIEVESL